MVSRLAGGGLPVVATGAIGSNSKGVVIGFGPAPGGGGLVAGFAASRGGYMAAVFTRGRTAVVAGSAAGSD